MQSFVGFTAVIAFILVNVVDPYSGAAAAPDFQIKTDRFRGQSIQKVIVDGSYSTVVARDDITIEKAPPPPPPPAAPPAAGSARGALPNVVPDPGSAQAYAHGAVLARGWGEDEFSCLVALWSKESGWRVNAINNSLGSGPSTSPYGIPQAYPGGKMVSAGPDWETNAETQVNWGLTYIAARGTPCSIWNNYGGSY